MVVDVSVNVGTMMSYVVAKISPTPWLIYGILLLGMVYLIGKYGLSWSLGILMALTLLSPIIQIVTEWSWIYYILFFIIFALIVYAIIRSGGPGD